MNMPEDGTRNAEIRRVAYDRGSPGLRAQIDAERYRPNNKAPKSDIERANRAIFGFLGSAGLLVIFAGAYLLLWLWWQSTGDIFAQPIASLSLAELVYGLCSRALVILVGIGLAPVVAIIWRKSP